MVFNYSGSFMDQVSVFAAGTFDADMVTDNPGTWMIHCHVSASLNFQHTCHYLFTTVLNRSGQAPANPSGHPIAG